MFRKRVDTFGYLYKKDAKLADISISNLLIRLNGGRTVEGIFTSWISSKRTTGLRKCFGEDSHEVNGVLLLESPSVERIKWRISMRIRNLIVLLIRLWINLTEEKKITRIRVSKIVLSDFKNFKFEFRRVE